jgi:pilus assembly protein CpaB
MANIGRTLLRFTGALTLAAGATAIDHPRVMADATLGHRAGGETPVIIATVNIPEGSKIEPGAVALVGWPAHLVPPGAYASVDSVAGRVATSAVFRGEPIMPGRLVQRPSAGLEVKITPGKRAYSIRVSDVTGIAGMIRPNSRVDILVTMDKPEGERRQRVSKIFMSDMRVLAFGAFIGREVDGRPTPRYVATIEVWPVDAELLAHAATQGSLSLALRGDGDSGTVTTNRAVGASAVEYLPHAATLVPRRRER